MAPLPATPPLAADASATNGPAAWPHARGAGADVIPPRPMRRARPGTYRSRAATPSVAAPVWLFDLDNTLHDTSFAIFPRIDAAMGQAVQDVLDVDRETAHALRERYWRRYGATMIGLARHHGVNARDFLLRSHDFPVESLVRAESSLARKLARLRGRKILLTNAPLDYAIRVLRHLRCLHLFDSLWGVEEMRMFGSYRPKPSRAMLRHVLAHENVRADQAILVEDTLENLRAARAVGMRTAYLFHPGTPFSRKGRNRPMYVDLRLQRFGQLVRAQDALAPLREHP